MPIYDSSSALGANTNGKVPNITGFFGITAQRKEEQPPTGAFYPDGAIEDSYNGGNNKRHHHQGFGFDASRCSSVYDNNATKITPAGINTLICIKY